MNIAIITSGFLPVPASKGGAVENLIQNIMNEHEISSNDAAFTIFSVFDKESEEISKKYAKSKVVFIKPNAVAMGLDKAIFFVAKNILKKENQFTYRYIAQRYFYLRKVSKLIARRNFDKIICENHPTQLKVIKWNNNSAKYAGRYYYHCHNEIKYFFGCKEIFKKCKKVLCVSNYIKNTIIESTDMEESRVVVVRNGIDQELFSKEISLDEKKALKDKLGIKENERIILFAGRLIPDKGAKELLESLDYIKSKNIRIVIIGGAISKNKVKTDYEDQIQALVERNKDTITFPGYIEYGDIYKYYKTANIVVLPSIWNDPAPLTIIESLHCGTPIITTKSGGIPEYASASSAIYLDRDAKDLPKKIALAIDELIDDEERLFRMSSSAKKDAKLLTKSNYYRTLMGALYEK